MSSQLSRRAALRPRAPRRDAIRNHQRILDAARDVLGESGAGASMEEIASRAGVGVGTVYRRFASKDALIDELLRLALEELLAAAEHALARTDGHGLEELLQAFGRSFRRACPLRAPATGAPARPRSRTPDPGRDRHPDRARRGGPHGRAWHHR